jgi:hypothetical protein
VTRKVTVSVSNVLALAIVAGLMTLFIWLFLPSFAESASSNGNSGYVRRYAANFTAYGFELVTTAAPLPNGQGGTVIYNKNFFVADDINTLYVTISATGDTHFGARLQLACLIDGDPCNPGAGNPAGGAPTGWFTAKRFANYNLYYTGVGFGGDGGGAAGDVHDNSIHKTWCTPFETKAGTHNVQIRMASNASPDAGSAGAQVFMEAVDFTIDGARVASDADRCSDEVLDATVATEPSSTTAPDGTIVDTTVFAPLTDQTSADTAVLSHDHADK